MATPVTRFSTEDLEKMRENNNARRKMLSGFDATKHDSTVTSAKSFGISFDTLVKKPDGIAAYAVADKTVVQNEPNPADRAKIAVPKIVRFAADGFLDTSKIGVSNSGVAVASVKSDDGPQVLDGKEQEVSGEKPSVKTSMDVVQEGSSKMPAEKTQCMDKMVVVDFKAAVTAKEQVKMLTIIAIGVMLLVVIGAIVQQPAVQQAASTMWTWTQGTGSAVWTAISGVASSAKKISYNFVAWTPTFIRMLYKNTENYFELNKKFVIQTELRTNKTVADCKANLSECNNYSNTTLLKFQNETKHLGYCLTNISEMHKQIEADEDFMKVAGQEAVRVKNSLTYCKTENMKLEQELLAVKDRREFYKNESNYHQDELKKLQAKRWKEHNENKAKHNHCNAKVGYGKTHLNALVGYKDNLITELKMRIKRCEISFHNYSAIVNATGRDVYILQQTNWNKQNEYAAASVTMANLYADDYGNCTDALNQSYQKAEELTAKLLNTTERLNISHKALQVVILQVEAYRIKSVIQETALCVVCVQIAAVAAAGLYYGGMAAYATGVVYFSTALP